MMIGLFLQEAVYGNDFNSAFAGGASGGLLAFLAAFMFFVFILAVAMYIVTSWAFMSIGRKVKYSSPGLAWIPIVGPSLIASKTAKMHWWPVLLLIGAWFPYIGGLFSLAFTVFFVIWLWKTYEAIDKPNWWAILYVIPVLGLVFLGIAAWSKK